MEKVKQTNKCNLVAFLLFFAFLVLWIGDRSNAMLCRTISFDDAYNAQVSKNFAEFNKYETSYPETIVFSNVITTGPTMLVPTGILFKAFGISELSIGLVPLIYSCIVLISIWILCLKIFERIKYRIVLSTLLTIFFVLINSWINYLSIILLGEIASFAFTLLATIELVNFFRKSKTKYIYMCGFFMANSFVSKSSQIFMCITITGCLLVNIFLFGKIKVKQWLLYILGVINGLFIWDIFKLFQFGSINGVIQWWIDEKANMFNQTQTVSVFDNFSIGLIRERFLYVNQIIRAPYWLIVIYLIIPIIFFIILLSMNKQNNNAYQAVCFYSLACESLIVYFVLFGSEGLMYARRMAVYGDGLVLFDWIIISCFFIMYKERNKRKYLSVVIAGMVCCIGLYGNNELIYANCSSLICKETQSEDKKSTELLVNYINQLPEDAVLYTYGWWQAPEVSLFLNKVFKDISSTYPNIENINFDKSYFIVGSLVEPPTWVWSGDFDSYLNQLFTTELIYQDKENDYTRCVYKLTGINIEKSIEGFIF